MSWLSDLFKRKNNTRKVEEKDVPKCKQLQPNNIRVFVSSTFKDLEEERSCLATQVFPRLRSFCYKKGLTFQDLDLRWGITEEESKSGQVVRLCLKGIDDSVPYFICILGDRYGWIPSENDINLGEGQFYKNFVKEQVDKERSITEIEIRYALLLKNRIKPFFFFKSSSNNSDPDDKIISLKDEIKLNYPESVFPFSTTDELHNIVYNLLTKDVEEKYPSSTTNSVLQEELLQDANTWKRLAESMLKLSSFDKCYTQLDRVLSDDTRLLWITSDNDSSHRYVTADWIKQNEKENRVFYFDCQNAVSRTNCYDILWKIYQRVNYLNSAEDVLHYNSKDSDIYSPIQELCIELEKISKETKTIPIFIIDNIDNCDDFSPRLIQEFELFSTKIHLVLLSSRAFYEKEGDVPVFAHLHIAKLSPDELSVFVSNYFEQYGKRVDKINCDKLTCNELFNDLAMLKLAMDTLRQYASFDNIKSFFGQISCVNTRDDLFRYVLSLIKRNYHSKESLMTNVLWLIIESRIGLSMNDLRTLTGTTPFAIYEIIDVLSQLLSYQNDQIKIVDKSLVRAINEVFKLTDSEIDIIDQKLIDFWENKKDVPNEKCAIYGLSEIYIKREEWDKLFKITANPTYFYYYLNNASELFQSRWELLKKHSSSDGYQFSFPIFHLNHSTLDKKNAESLAWTYLSVFQTSQTFLEEEQIIEYLKETKALIEEFGMDGTYLESVLMAFYSKYYLKKNQLNEALSFAQDSLAIRKEIYLDYSEVVLKAKRLLFQIFTIQGNMTELEKLIHDFEIVISTSDEIFAEERIKVLNIIIEFYERNRNIAKIKKYSKDLIETTRKFYTKDSDEYIISVYNYCDNLDDINEPEESYQILKEIVDSDYFKNMTTSNRKIALSFYYLKAKVLYGKESDVWKELLSLLEKCPNDNKCKEFILSNGTSLLLNCGMYENSLNWSDQEIELCLGYFSDKLGPAYERKGAILHYMGKPEKALESFFNAEKEYFKVETIESTSHLANLYASIGACYAQISDKKCVTYIKKSIDISESILGKVGFDLALRYKNLGLAYLYICKEYRLSVWALEKAMGLYKEADIEDELIEISQRIAEAYHKAGYFRKAIEVIPSLPQNNESQKTAYAIMQDIRNCTNCLGVIKEFRQYGMNNFNPIATIRLLTSEFFIACYEAGLNPIIEESGLVFVYLEGREYCYTPSEQFCDTVIVRSKINLIKISEEELSKINKTTIKVITKNEKTNHDEAFLVLPDNGNYILLSTFKLGEMETFREDCMNLLNIATNIIREIEEK